jgi:hypothetical protein
MFAIIAAILFGFALFFDLIDANLGDVITLQVLMLAGLLFLALQFTGAASWRGTTWRRRRR